MQQPGLIVCEREGWWAAGLRVAVDDPDIAIHETRVMAHCREALALSPGSILALEIDGDAQLETVLSLLMELRDAFPQAAAVVLAPRHRWPYEGLVRELGAVHFVRSRRNLHPAASIVRRHTAGVAVPRRSFLEQIDDLLPWKSHAV